MSVYVIAEAAATHDWKFVNAKELVKIAKEAGADAVKFQYCSNPAKMAHRRHVENMLTYEYLNLDDGWLCTLADLTHQTGLEFLCTVFVPEDIPLIAHYVDRFKVASLESFDESFLLAHEPYGKEIIVSTGCHDEASRRKLIHWTGRLHRGETTAEYALLHCIAAYPCPIDQVNFQWMCDQPLNGFSDHTGQVITGALAAMAGAEIIEVHFKGAFTLPNNQDYMHALWPQELKQYVEFVRQAELVFGEHDERIVLPCEESLLPHRVLPT